MSTLSRFPGRFKALENVPRKRPLIQSATPPTSNFGWQTRYRKKPQLNHANIHSLLFHITEHTTEISEVFGAVMTSLIIQSLFNLVDMNVWGLPNGMF